MIELKNVSKVYDNGSIALDHVSLHIGKGEFVFVVGASGAGKSTLIKLLSHEELPSRGSVFVNGIEVNKLAKGRVPYLRRKMGIVFQDFRSCPIRRPRKTWPLHGSHRSAAAPHPPPCPGRPRPGRPGGQSRRLPRNLSGGEQQRVAIARAIVNRPLLLIADEPTGNLDPETSQDIMEVFKKINHMGTTVLMVTHDKTLVDMMEQAGHRNRRRQVVRDEQKGIRR